jgi:hypothetical protein
VAESRYLGRHVSQISAENQVPVGDYYRFFIAKAKRNPESASPGRFVFEIVADGG